MADRTRLELATSAVTEWVIPFLPLCESLITKDYGVSVADFDLRGGTVGGTAK